MRNGTRALCDYGKEVWLRASLRRRRAGVPHSPEHETRPVRKNRSTEPPLTPRSCCLCLASCETGRPGTWLGLGTWGPPFSAHRRLDFERKLPHGGLAQRGGAVASARARFGIRARRLVPFRRACPPACVKPARTDPRGAPDPGRQTAAQWRRPAEAGRRTSSATGRGKPLMGLVGGRRRRRRACSDWDSGSMFGCLRKASSEASLGHRPRMFCRLLQRGAATPPAIESGCRAPRDLRQRQVLGTPGDRGLV
jgi:hypothetical protein